MKGISAALKADSPVVLVTGCSDGGIGHSLCLEFAARGCRVFATSRKLGTMVSLLQQPGITTLELDVTVQGSIEAAVASVLSQAGRIDILVNNAGVLMPCPFADLDLQDARSQFETNFFGALTLTQAVLPGMMARRSGKIVNVSSMAASLPWPAGGIYCASKASLSAWSDALRVEVEPFGVQVTVLTPGIILSNIYSKALPTDANKGKQWRWYGYLQEKMIASFTKSMASRVGMPADVFAKQTCKQVLRKSMPAYHAIGFSVTASKIALLFRKGIMDAPYKKMMKFDTPVPAGSPKDLVKVAVTTPTHQAVPV
ncbi:MAG: hypothetical protein WDW36_003741 [Sanguina aurantia]